MLDSKLDRRQVRIDNPLNAESVVVVGPSRDPWKTSGRTLDYLARLGFGGRYYAVSSGVDRIKDQFSSAEDYPGPGTGEVVFEVKPGDTITAMGRGLKDAGVVASVDAFISAASDNPRSSSIQARSPPTPASSRSTTRYFGCKGPWMPIARICRLGDCHRSGSTLRPRASS